MKLRIRAVLLAFAVMLFMLIPAGVTADNRGDTWTDNVGQASGPGHEQDPHLACVDINLWGNDMADSGGTYTVDSWPPSGNRETVYAASWAYNRQQGGSQVMSVIDVATLVANARADGAAPVNKQGYHFKLQLAQDPQKHKTFWVDCPSGQPQPTPTPPAESPLPAEGPAPAGGELPAGTVVPGLPGTGHPPT